MTELHHKRTDPEVWNASFDSAVELAGGVEIETATCASVTSPSCCVPESSLPIAVNYCVVAASITVSA
ncbi:hypothetical protein LSAT2_021499 [Lamellibrachia satsuma]|nr:hypothetical protein LSAT2_021499 [Lamellibrachia satsuma]